MKITILGEEGVPVQVDGEAWVQPPGIVRIVHKNRAQMLTRDRVSLPPAPHPPRSPSNAGLCSAGLREHAQVLGGQEEGRELPRQQAPPQLAAVHGVPDGGGVRAGAAAGPGGRHAHQQVGPAPAAALDLPALRCNGLLFLQDPGGGQEPQAGGAGAGARRQCHGAGADRGQAVQPGGEEEEEGGGRARAQVTSAPPPGPEPQHGGGDRQQQQGAAGRDQDAAGREAAGEPPLAASQEPGAVLAPPCAPQAESPEEAELGLTLSNLSAELLKLEDIHWICPLMQGPEEVGPPEAAGTAPDLRPPAECVCVCVRSRRAAARAA